jgi:hypothetical protein
MSQLENAAPEPPLWRRVWSPPEPEISTAGFGGELLVAGVRLLIVVVLLYFPIHELLQKPGGYDPLALLTTATIGLFLALVVYSATSRRWGRSWIGFASSVLDVSLVSAMLGVFLVLGRPQEATNNLAVYPIYFLAIAHPVLRPDRLRRLALAPARHRLRPPRPARRGHPHRGDDRRALARAAAAVDPRPLHRTAQPRRLQRAARARGGLRPPRERPLRGRHAGHRPLQEVQRHLRARRRRRGPARGRQDPARLLPVDRRGGALRRRGVRPHPPRGDERSGDRASR